MTTPEQTTASIASDQSGLHPNLAAVVSRHLSTTWRKPAPKHTRVAFDALVHWLAERQAPLVLDSFCGTGMSTAQLAERFPHCAVVGIDKSAARLGRHGSDGPYLLLRAECEPLWQLLVTAGHRVAQHYLLYPNPWPKGAHLKRRIHGHPGFAALRALGGQIELRTNWQIYAEEFATAMAIAGVSAPVQPLAPHVPMTLFEKKYLSRDQALWQWQGNASS